MIGRITTSTQKRRGRKLFCTWKNTTSPAQLKVVVTAMKSWMRTGGLTEAGTVAEKYRQALTKFFG
jgi:hypothetical protein